jgi:hypothetical protein
MNSFSGKTTGHLTDELLCLVTQSSVENTRAVGGAQMRAAPAHGTVRSAL